MSKLFIIPTPIGNLDDISFRVIHLLKTLDIILAEDTRRTKKIFSHYEIHNKIECFHSHNEHKKLDRYINKLKLGEQVGMVSDAGTPGISDPGFLLVRECIRAGIEVICIPGPTAFIPALITSGIPCDRFVFEGFLPLKKGRKKRLEELSTEKRTIIFYESPHRIIKTLGDLSNYFGLDRIISISREISKMYEETNRGTIKDLLCHFKQQSPKGEFVIVLSGLK